MPLPPLVPLGGYGGLRLLDQTRERQIETFSRSPDLERRIAAFRERADGVTSIDALMADRDVLAVALGAFGLEDQAGNRAFLRKILEDGVARPDALAMRLTDTRWRSFASAFQFGETAGRFRIAPERAEIVAAYEARALRGVEAAADSQLRAERIEALVAAGTPVEAITEADLEIRADLRLERVEQLRREIRADADYVRAAGDAAATLDIFLGDQTFRRVALGAFGLAEHADDVDRLRRYLEGGHRRADAPARLDPDPNWARFVEAMDFAGTRGPLVIESAREDIVARFVERGFEGAVGEQQPDLELALAFRREIGAIAAGPNAERSGWLRIMGQTGLRAVVEGVFGLPSSFAALDIDRQVATLEARSEARFGSRSPAVFRDPAVVEDAVRQFLARRQLEAGPSPGTAGSVALQLLQGGSLGSATTASLFGSNLL